MSSGSILDERGEYLKNPYFDGHLFGEFTPFYVTITVCTFFALFLFVLNFVFGCCSIHKYYWQDRHTGNRWLVSLWTTTAFKQPPLDLADVEAGAFQPTFTDTDTQSAYNFSNPPEYLELQKRDDKRESEI